MNTESSIKSLDLSDIFKNVRGGDYAIVYDPFDSFNIQSQSSWGSRINLLLKIILILLIIYTIYVLYTRGIFTNLYNKYINHSTEQTDDSTKPTTA